MVLFKEFFSIMIFNVCNVFNVCLIVMQPKFECQPQSYKPELTILCYVNKLYKAQVMFLFAFYMSRMKFQV